MRNLYPRSPCLAASSYGDRRDSSAITKSRTASTLFSRAAPNRKRWRAKSAAECGSVRLNFLSRVAVTCVFPNALGVRTDHLRARDGTLIGMLCIPGDTHLGRQYVYIL